MQDGKFLRKWLIAMDTKKAGGRLFYGWVILGCCMIMTACSTGILSYFNALFVDPVTSSLGVSRAVYMLYSTFSTVATMIFMPVAGILYKKYPLKPLVILGALCGAGSLLLYSTARHVYLFYVGGILSGIGMCLFGSLPMTMVLNNWFAEKRGFVTGIAFMGSALVSALLSPTVSDLITNFGYQAGYRFLAVLLLGLMLPSTLLLLKVTPEEKGLKPYGMAPEQNSGEKTGFSYSRVLRSPAFWIFAAAVLILGLTTYGTQSHLIAYWTSVGIAPETASTLYSGVMVVSAAAKMMLGNVYDRFGIAKGSALFCTAGALAMLSLLLCTQGWLVLLPVVLFGMMTSIQVLITSYVASRLFGEKEYSAIFGLLNTVLFCGVSVGVPLNALLYDVTESYQLGWILFFALMVAALAAILAANKLSKKMFQKELGITRGE